MDWIYGLKLLLLACGSLFLLALSIFVFYLIRIAIEVRFIIRRVEMVTDVRNWVNAFKKIGSIKRFYEQSRD